MDSQSRHPVQRSFRATMTPRIFLKATLLSSFLLLAIAKDSIHMNATNNKANSKPAGKEVITLGVVASGASRPFSMN
jgi:hypothetical protein